MTRHNPGEIPGVLWSLFSFTGRMRRRDYWYYYAVSILLMVLLLVTSVLAPQLAFPAVHETPASQATFGVAVMLIATFAFLIWIWTALLTKRLHDRGKSMIWLLALFVPVLGWMYLFYDCGLVEGDTGQNRFGPSPKLGRNVRL